MGQSASFASGNATLPGAVLQRVRISEWKSRPVLVMESVPPPLAAASANLTRVENAMPEASAVKEPPLSRYWMSSAFFIAFCFFGSSREDNPLVSVRNVILLVPAPRLRRRGIFFFFFRATFFFFFLGRLESDQRSMTLPAEPVRRGALFEKPGLFKNFESRPKIFKVGQKF